MATSAGAASYMDDAVATLELLQHLDRARLAVARPQYDGAQARDQPLFPDAQRILDGEQPAALFPRVQRSLGLLQAVILYGLPVDDSRDAPLKLAHLETTLGLRVPWLSVPHDESGATWQAEPARRASILASLFHRFREGSDHSVQEFIDHMPIAGLRAKRVAPASQLENEGQFLLVSDSEQSLFSLLFVLLEAADAGAARVHAWLADESGTTPLRSVFCQVELDGIRPPRARSLAQPWGDHYWKEATAAHALQALGLEDRDGAATPRYRRLRAWLSEPDGPGQRALERSGLPPGLARQMVEAARPADRSPRELASEIARVLTAHEEWRSHSAFSSSDTLCTPRARVRFNLPGEYLLRRDENIARSFFATPLSLMQIGEERAFTAAFALGSLLDLDESPAAHDLTLRRLALLRQLLGSVAAFGLTHTLHEQLLQIELQRRERRRSRWVRHQVFGTLSALHNAICELPGVSSEERARKVLRRFGSVLTLFEYLNEQPLGDYSHWPCQPHEMLRCLVDWLEPHDRLVDVQTAGPNPSFAPRDALTLYIVLLNLVQNALHNAGKGGYVILRCAPTEAGAELVVSIENSGKVMDADYAAYLEGRLEGLPVPESGRDDPPAGLATVRDNLGQLGSGQRVRVTAPATDGGGTRIEFGLPGNGVLWNPKDQR